MFAGVSQQIPPPTPYQPPEYLAPSLQGYQMCITSEPPTIMAGMSHIVPPPRPVQAHAHAVSVARTNHTHFSAIQRFLLLHLRYGHLSYPKLYAAIKLGFIKGFGFSIDVIHINQLPVCEHCLKANAHVHAPSNHGRWIAIRPGLFWHTDTKYFKTRSSGRWYYMQAFVDDNSGVGFIFGYTHKWQALTKALIPFNNMLGLKYQMRQYTLRADKAGEFVSQQWDEYCNSNSILTQYIPAGQHGYNGVAEVRLKNLMQLVRPMLAHSQLPTYLYDEAAYTANDVFNDSPVAPTMETRNHRFSGKISDADDYHVFGAKAILSILPPVRDIKMHGLEVRYLGKSREPESSAHFHRVYNPHSRSITESPNVDFIESDRQLLDNSYDLNTEMALLDDPGSSEEHLDFSKSQEDLDREKWWAEREKIQKSDADATNLTLQNPTTYAANVIAQFPSSILGKWQEV
jgi:hypothetical protein